MFKRLIDRYLGPRPKKVNCWYCGQDSYLLPGSGQTPRQFYCNLCENTNSRDETGEIQDPVPTQSQSSNGGQEYCVKTTLQVSSKEFCENCIADQRMNRMYLNQYIPDENDPSFKSRWDSAKTYEQYLDEKTPLCKDCQIKVDKFNAAQETRLPKKIDIKDTVSQDTTSFRLLDESQKAALIYFLSKCLWVTAHILAVIFNFYGYCYPPRSVQTSDVEDISVMASKGDNDSLDMLKLVVKNMLSKLPNLIGCLISCQDNKKNCAMTSDCTIFYYTLNTLSIFVLYWHPIVSLEYENDNPKAKHYDVYKSCQVLLFLYRMTLPTLLHYTSSNLSIVFLVVYISILYFTTSYVQAQGYRVLKKVGKNLTVNNTTSSANVTPTPSSSNTRSSRFINDDLKEAMTYKRNNSVDYSDIAIERDDALHRTTYDLNKLTL